MKRILSIALIIFLIIMVTNALFYYNLHKQQVAYQEDLLTHQVEIAAGQIEGGVGAGFYNDLMEIFYYYGNDFQGFFTDENSRYELVDRFKFFYNSYENFVKSIKLYNNRSQTYHLYKDNEGKNWVEDEYEAQIQPELLIREDLVIRSGEYYFYIPIIESESQEIAGNLVVAIDYIKYMESVFRKESDMADFQWQWIMDDEGKVLSSNSQAEIDYENTQPLIDDIMENFEGTMVHEVRVEGKRKKVISSYYLVDIMRKEFVVVFSAQMDFIQKYIIRNSLIISVITFFLIGIIIFVFYRYIRQQKEISYRLQSRLDNLFEVLEKLPVGLVIFDRKETILRGNTTAARLFDFNSAVEMKGKSIPQHIISGDSLFFSENLGATFQPNQFLLVERDGVERVLYRQDVEVPFEGQDARMEAFIDVSLLEQARKREARANEAKSEFMAKMSHEIRTPLNGIIGMMDILHGQEMDIEAREVVGIVRKSADLLMSIISDLLDFSKLEAGKMMIEEIPFNLSDELKYTLDLHEAENLSKISILLDVDEEVPSQVIGDPFRLRQVLSNLITNCLKMTTQGEVRASVGVQEESDGSIRLRFTVQDTGKGMSPEELAVIFGREVQGSHIPERTDQGSGIGIAISKQLVELMGGEIHAVSPSEISTDPRFPGTRFVFTVNVYSSERLTKDFDASDITTYSQIKTLIINGRSRRDNELLEIFHRFGISTYVTSWQKQTLHLIKTNYTDAVDRYRLLVILDSEEFDGFEIARALWEKELVKHFLIIMISSNDVKGNYSRCIRYGIDHYLVKPFQASEIFDFIQNNFQNIAIELPADVLDTIPTDLSILVAEDNLINQKVAQTMFKNLGFEISLAANGKIAVEMCREKKYDVIFMDLMMPEMDGYEATRQILELHADIPVIALTADTASDARRRTEEFGMQGFIPKPVKVDEIKKCMIDLFMNR